jgi:hypothetical protein
MTLADARCRRSDRLRSRLWSEIFSRLAAFSCWGSVSVAAQNVVGFGTRLRAAAIPGRRADAQRTTCSAFLSRSAKESG